jgi:XTP/dITP diphosphohydrolase
MTTESFKPKLLIATSNPGKMREYAGLLRDAPFQLVSLADLGITHEVDETGDTFAENAQLKASEYGSNAGILTLADDSGLEVDALGGEPGVFSARYGEKSPLIPIYEGGGQVISPSEPRSDQDRVDLLLKNLEGVPWERRTARFRCVLAIWFPPSRDEPPEDRSSQLAPKDAKKPPFVKGGWGGLAPAPMALLVGSISGMIQYQPMGEDGFGYDPVFLLPSYGLTMAQLPLEEKNRISHRANAAGKAVKVLNQAFSGQPPAFTS